MSAHSSGITQYHIKNAIAAFFFVGSMAFIVTSYGFFVYPVTTDLNFQISHFSVFFSLTNICAAMAMVLWSKLIAIFGIKKCALISSSISSVAIVFASLCSTLTEFYITGIIIGVASPGCTLLPATILINSWFEKNKGTIFGIVMTASSIAGAILSAGFSSFLLSYGWRNGYLLMAFLFFVFTFCFALLVTNNPADKGVEVYGKIENTVKFISSSTFSYAKIFKLYNFYLLFFAFVFLAISLSFIPQTPLYLKNSGFSVAEVSLCASLLMLFIIIGKTAQGILCDQLGIRRTIVISMLALGAGFLMLAYLESILFIVIIALFMYALGAEAVLVITPMTINKVFGSENYTEILGIMMITSPLGMTIGTPVWGFFFDKYGTFSSAIPFMITVAIIGTILFLFATNTDDKTKKVRI